MHNPVRPIRGQTDRVIQPRTRGLSAAPAPAGHPYKVPDALVLTDEAGPGDHVRAAVLHTLCADAVHAHLNIQGFVK